MSLYELERDRNLLQNRQKLNELGLAQLPKIPLPPVKERNDENDDFPPTAKRISRRLKGDLPEINMELANRVVDHLPNDTRYVADPDIKNFLNSILDKEELNYLKSDVQETTFVNLDNITFPLRLKSINVSILRLGDIQTDLETRKNYWSHKQCLFKHPYPVGFRSVKHHFSKTWYQSIIKGDDGFPIFEVVNEDGHKYVGRTPTAAWNQYLDSNLGKHGATRISGPFFFGFSDQALQNLIKNLPNYNPWSVVKDDQ